MKKFQDSAPKVRPVTEKFVFIDPVNVDGASTRAFHVAGADSCNNDANTAQSLPATLCGLSIKTRRIKHRCLSAEDAANLAPNFKKNNEALCPACMAALAAPKV